MSLKKLFSSSFFFIFSALSFAASITSFSYSGLVKTKENYLNKVLEHFYGQELTEDTLHQIETVLHSEGIFESIGVAADEHSEGQVNITVKEKITFIPLPFAVAGSSYWLAGGMLLNMNAFGNKTTLITGLFFSDSRFSGIFGLSKPAANVNDTGWSVFTGAGNSQTTVTDLYGNEILKYKSFSSYLSTSLQKKLTPFTSVQTGIGVNYAHFTDAPVFSEPYIKSNSFQARLSTGFSHGKNDWNGWFLNSKMFTGSLEAGYDFTAETDFYRASSSITFQQPLTGRLRLCAAVSGIYSYDTILSSWSGQGGAAVSILPDYFITEEEAGGNAGLEFALKKFKWGLFSIYANWQACAVKISEDEYKFCQGISGGTRVYLSKIAFPAFAFGMSRNITTKKLYWSGSLGISY